MRSHMHRGDMCPGWEEGTGKGTPTPWRAGPPSMTSAGHCCLLVMSHGKFNIGKWCTYAPVAVSIGKDKGNKKYEYWEE